MDPLKIVPSLTIPIGPLTASHARTVPFTGLASPFDTGRWAVSAVAGHSCAFGVEWEGVIPSETIESLDITMGWGRGNEWREVSTRSFPAGFPPGSKGNLYGQWTDATANSRYYSMRIQWTPKDTVGLATRLIEEAKRNLAGKQTGLLTSPLPHDVELVFERDGGLSLWGSRKVLAAASPYFQTLFDSGLQESEMATSVDIATPSGDVRRALECDDSDDDSPPDELAPRANRQKTDVPSFKHHIIKVNEVSYRTYHAVLCWIYTSHIDFAPLLSSFPGSPSEARLALSSHLSSFSNSSPSLPLPASPKSVYRLAHFLEIPALKTAALANLKSQLTPANIATELFSETSGKYEEVLDVLGDYAASHREEMKKSQGWKESTKGIDGLEGVGRVFARLAEKIL